MKTLTDSMAATLNTSINLGQLAETSGTGGRPQPESSKKSSSERFSAEEKAQFAVALMQVCQMQHQLGKSGKDFETMVKGFLWVLGDYPMPRIIDALAQYAREKPDIPAPADLVKIIDPPPPPKQELSAALYVAYQKKTREGGYLLSDERAYCRAFEAQEHAKVRGGNDTLREAQKEIEQHSKRLALGFDGSDYD